MTSITDRLQFAVKYKIQPDDIKILVETKPIIDTANENDKNAFLMANINASSISNAELKNAKRVMYWKKEDTGYVTKITGIAWIDDIENIFFEGEILTP